MRCQNCGSETRDGAKFCRNCGASLTTQTSAEVGVVCPKCGSRAPENALFCIVCGTTLNNFENPDEKQRSENVINRKKAADKKFTALVVIILAVVVVCAGIIVFMLNFSASDTYEEPFDGFEENTEDEEEYPDAYDIFANTPDDDEDYDYDNEGYIDTRDDEYLFPSDREYITRSDLDSMTKDEVALVRNEIYARHGFVFTKEPFLSYFADKEWYTPNEDFDESMFNDIEDANKDFIVNYETEKGWR